MDTPFDQRVPLAEAFRRRGKIQRHHKLASQSGQVPRWVVYLLFLSAAVWWMNIDSRTKAAVDTIAHSQPLLHRNIARDVEEAQTLLQHLEDYLTQAQTHFTVPKLEKVLNGSSAVLSDATSFTSCHDLLVQELKRPVDANTSCRPLFNDVINCRYKFTTFQNGYNQLRSHFKVDVGLAVKITLSEIRKWERGRAEDTIQEQFSWSGIKQSMQGAVGRYHEPHGPGRDEDYQLGQRVTNLRDQLIEWLARLEGHPLMNTTSDSHRRVINENYNLASKPFHDAGCEVVNPTCLCIGLDLEKVQAPLEKIGSEIAYLDILN